MKLPVKKCDNCENTTTLMYSAFDQDDVRYDHYVCQKCLENELINAMLTYAVNREGSECPTCADALQNMPLSKFLAIDEAITANLEFAELKIQRIHPMMGMELKPDEATIVIAVRSIINGQYHMWAFNADRLMKLVDYLDEVLKEEFQNSTYPEDIVPY